jgi:hypothetical protein
VQTYRNPVSGVKLFMFVRHYLSLGYTVLVYDRFGAHAEDVAPLLALASSSSSSSSTRGELKYFPYTALELAIPRKYNQAFASRQVSRDSSLSRLRCFAHLVSMRKQGSGFKYYDGSHNHSEVSTVSLAFVCLLPVQ